MTATINASTSAGVVTTADTSGILQLQTNGTAALTVDASQNVGIGQISPSFKLDVTGTLRSTGEARFDNAINLKTATLNQVYFDDAVAFTRNGTGERMRIDSSGNVGIGTASPNNKLDVQAATAKVGVTSTTGTNTTFYSANNTGGSFYFGLDNSAGTEFGTAYAGAIYRSGAYPITFYTNAAERARIDSSGNLLVGKTATGISTVGTIILNGGEIQITRDGAPPFLLNRLTNDGTIQEFRRSGTQVGGVNVTTTATTYATSSDYRLKETIIPMTGALAKVALLKPSIYKWKVDGSDGQGFIAHELQAIVPECVTGEKDAVETYIDEDGNEATRPVYQGIDTSFLVATLTAAIQELKAIVDGQAVLIAAQGAEIAALKGATA